MSQAKSEAGQFDVKEEAGTLRLILSGRWILEFADGLDSALDRLDDKKPRTLVIDGQHLTSIDTVGAWLLARTKRLMEARGAEVLIEGINPTFAPLLERVLAQAEPEPVSTPPRLRWQGLEFLGRLVVDVALEGRALLNFFGAIIVAWIRLFREPRRLRLISTISHIEQTGLKALPIVGLISFLVGVVLAYQGVDQLKRFNAQAFTVNLVGISVLREMGILLTAIVVAGRSGSAFTAQIGTMQVNQEVDAMRTLGLDPIDVLVLPRVFGLIIALPLLTFFADIMGLLGGGVMSVVLLDFTPYQFVRNLQDAVALKHLWVGLSKAPIFAFIIAMVGCFEGLRVSGSAESVGRMTTQSVVEAIFLVIIFDAFFSILFSYLGI